MKAVTHQNDAWEAWRPGVETRMLVSALNGSAQLCVFEQHVMPGVGAPTHRHPVEEVLTVREGEAEMWIEDERVTVRSGQSLIVPAGRMHGFRNSGEGALHIHAVLASPVFESLPELANAHAAGREIKLENAALGSPVPLHPGAIRYYKEKGLIK